MSNRRKILGASLVGLCVTLLACGLSGDAIPGLQETVVALEYQQTSLAQTAALYTQSAMPYPSQTSIIEPLTTNPPEPLISTAGPLATATEVELTAPTPTSQPISTETDMERWMRSAKILVFEDMSGSREIRFVKEALDQLGYFYLDVGSAKGWFKSQLLSPVDWDLVIAAAEARRGFGGEYFEYIYNRVSQDSATIIEYYDLDLAPMGMAAPLLNLCGVKIQSDWYEPEMRTFWWLLPDHPIFLEPNEMPPTLRNAAPIWRGDIGDLVEVKLNAGQPVGDAVILASTNPDWTTDHGVLTTCLDGRMILQTFSSHEYRREDMVPLWQNYIYNTLKSRFKVKPPTGVITSSSMNFSQAPSPAAPVDAGIGMDASCGWMMSVRVPVSPVLEKDLFEHHAEGVYLILQTEVVNKTDQTLMVWDGDYALEATLNGELVTYVPDKAATGYLYIESPRKLYQDQIEPGIVWRTTLAFDIDPQAKDLVFVLEPGNEFDEPICEARIFLEQ